MSIATPPVSPGRPAAAGAADLLDRHEAELRQALRIRRTEQKLLAVFQLRIQHGTAGAAGTLVLRLQTHE